MPSLLSCQSISKSYSSRPLFRGLNFSVEESDRLGMIGPNGAGKSTLLKLMCGLVSPDEGTLTPRRGLRTAYIPQTEIFPSGKTVYEILNASLTDDLEEHEKETRINIIATKTGLEDLTVLAETLSGGWRKRLSIASKLITEPDLLMLDEPTNHLDVAGVLWLEELLNSSGFAFIVITHDRTFLENVSNRIVEVNPVYADGFLSVKGKYSDFLESRSQYIGAQAHLEQAIASKVRREIAWLQRGARARQTKAQARIKEAGKLIDSLAEVKFRNSQTASVEIDFDASGRKTKELIVAKNLKKSLGGRALFNDVSFILAPGTKLGILGTNGSGKTTLLKMLSNELTPDTGSIKRADDLRVVVFDQNREQLDQSKTLKESLCATGDAVTYRGRQIHVATWSKKFLFRSDQLHVPISYLSGGEQSRILIANLMLQPADVLILDEPTNDLDIPSLEVLEDSLEDFPGAVVLVTHDRFMLDNVSTTILSLDGQGGCAFFADYSQWENNQQKPNIEVSAPKGKAVKPTKQQPAQKKLSTWELKELDELPDKIDAAEKQVKVIEEKLADPKVASDHVQVQQTMSELESAQANVDKLYKRWNDLEARAAM